MSNEATRPRYFGFVSHHSPFPTVTSFVGGSCWAFAVIGAVEGAWATAGNTLTSLSEQQIVSCDKADGNAGCNGGEQITAMQWLAKQKGLCTEKDYPYTSGGGKDGKCETTCTPAMKITAGVELPARNESMLMAAIAMTPLSLSVDASDDSIWQSYSGGVVTASCPCNKDSCLDHGVTAVGYGSDGTNDYFTVKNSWGTDWGVSVSLRLKRPPPALSVSHRLRALHLPLTLPSLVL